MTRRRFYAPLVAFAEQKGSVTLSAEETQHARDVLRLHRGDEVYVFDGQGHEYRCVISEIGRASAKLDLIAEVEPTRRESPLDLTLAVALLKGEKFDLVVQKATELGVSRLTPMITTRADVRIRDAEEAKRKTERWQRIALESAKQCGRARLMEIEAPVEFQSFIDHPGRDTELRLMFAERGGESLAQALENPALQVAKVTALVGSEGGWTDEEIAQARNNDWKIVTLEGRTLRAETAVIVVGTLLEHRFGDLV
jgi:16S rRNA (uracil1498-N3)-methyltransferase